MDKYDVKLTSRAVRDIDKIYAYISNSLLAPEAALKLVEKLEEAIFSLDTMPYRCVERKTGAYAYRGYRQMIVKNYTVIFRINEAEKKVIIVTIRYSPSNF